MNELPSAGPVLVTVLGTNPRRLRYRLGDASVEASYAGVALAQLLPAPPRKIVAVCTPKAEQDQLPEFRQAASGIVVEPRRVELPPDSVAVRRVVELLAQALLGEQPVIVDLTNGPRHIAVLAFAAAALVSGLGESDIRGVYYAWVADSTADFLDLRGLLTVLDLTHAARSFAETGSPGGVASFLGAVGGKSAIGATAQAARESLESFAGARLAGLPLEQGRAAWDVWNCRRSLRRLLEDAGLPMADGITTALLRAVEPIRLKAGGQGWKRRVPLNPEELDRQRRIIDERIRVGAWNTALLLMEEWLVSWAIWREDRRDSWLEKAVRATAAHRLHSLRKIATDDPGRLTEEQRLLADLWARLSEARNSFAHAGMRGEPVDPAKGRLRDDLAVITDTWSWLATDPQVSLSTAGPEPIMVSPLGRSPGALYTALRRYPAVGRCLVVTSSEAVGSLDELAGRLGRPVVFERLMLADPLAGAGELPGLVARARPRLLDAAAVYVHLTGGSTLMGHSCERLAEEAHRYGRPVHRFLTLDRRPPAVQATDPYVEGEVVMLDNGATEEGF